MDNNSFVFELKLLLCLNLSWNFAPHGIKIYVNLHKICVRDYRDINSYVMLVFILFK